jgi:hypothetical protein
LFKITQHKIDEELLIAIKQYLNFGYCYLRKAENTADLKGTKITEISQIIISFFTNYLVLGVKFLDFKDWCLISEMVKKRTSFRKR